MRSTFAALILLLGFGTAPALAQQDRSPGALSPTLFDQYSNALTRGAGPALVVSETAIVNAVTAPAAAVRVQPRDSLKNGAIIGAVVGGLAMGVFAGVICYALHEEGNPSCVPGTLMIGALGAGIGAAAGAGIDALATRPPTLVRPTMQLKVRF